MYICQQLSSQAPALCKLLQVLLEHRSSPLIRSNGSRIRCRASAHHRPPSSSAGARILIAVL